MLNPTRFEQERCLVCRLEREISPSSSVNTDVQHEIQRFRNRAALAEHVLKEKMSDLKLLKKKLVVLQDVVQRLQRSHRGERTFWEQQIQRNSTQWRAKWEDEEQKRLEVEISLRNLQDDLNRTRHELEAQRNNFETSLTQLQDSYDRDRKQWQREKRLQQEHEKTVQLEIAALQKEVLDMDQSLEHAQNELAKIQQGHKMRVIELEQVLQEELRKNKELQRQLDDALSEKQKIILEMKQLSASVNESVLIASSSVQAAEKRELTMQLHVETLQQQIETLIQKLNQTKTEETSQDQELNAAKVLKLQSEVDRLENQLRMERLSAATQKRIDQRQFEEALTRQRDQYELKLRWNAMQDVRKPPRGQGLWSRLRSRLSKSIHRNED
jgi:DNA repair exonuclease SbcCD ATPase subunit